MTTHTSSVESMKDALKKVLQQNIHNDPPTISVLFDLLGQAQEALRESGYPQAVLEMRQGLQSDYGLRYTVYLRDNLATFENPMFSVFIGGSNCAFQAEGQIQNKLNSDEVVAEAREYLLRPYVVELMTGLLRQFSRSSSSSVRDTPVTSLV